uniref:Metalloendopeptidase n=1 Tax=Steinernema glaseri TaxID=37863 RepID=A0A1I7YWG6_9BILA
MWIHSTLVFLALLVVLPGWAMLARPAAGSQSNPRHSKKQKENLDAINLNTKPRKDEDGRLTIYDINFALGLHEIFTDGDVVPSPYVSQAVSGAGGAPSLFRSRFQRSAPFRDSQYPATIWTNGVNWDFDPTLSELPQPWGPTLTRDVLDQTAKDAITAAIAFWQQNTCITFNRVNAATADPSMYPIVVFYPGAGCGSPVGRLASADFQKISIANGCEAVYIAAHEIGHTLGMHHTQRRYDRDDSIYIDTSNIMTGHLGSFAKQTTDNNYNYDIPYDFRSVMHYSPELFAINASKPVIYALNPAYQQSVGSQQLPSFVDVAMMNLHYSCYDRCNTSGTFCYYGGYPNPNNCKVCQCPNGFGGDDCSLPEPPTNGLTCGGQFIATSDWQVLNVVNQVGNGQKDITLDSASPSMCTYQIFAPTGSQVQFSVLFVGADYRNDYQCYDECYEGGVSIKGIGSSWKPQGMRICCPAQCNQIMNTTSNLLVVQPYNFNYYTDFIVKYKIA